MKLISFSIPVYNNEGSLKLTYEEIKKLFQSDLSNYEFEIWFTNDGSKDESLLELLSLRRQDSRVKIIDFSRNFGQWTATVVNYKYASGDAIITLSADLQDPISKVVDMIKKWESGDEIVICYRSSREKKMFNSVTSKIRYFILRKHTNSKMPIGGFDYFLMDKVAVEAINRINDTIRTLQYDVFSLGFKIGFIPYSRLERTIGKSQYDFFSRLSSFTDEFFTYSKWPIRFMALCGLGTSFFGFVYSLMIFLAWLKGETPFKGWAPLMIIFLVVSGIMMLMMAAIGEYLLRVYSEVKKRPWYIVRKIFD